MARAASKQTEAWLTAKVKKALPEIFPGGFFTKTSPGPWSAEGTPDFIGCTDEGIMTALELKAPTYGKNPMRGLRDSQKTYLYTVAKLGGVAIVCNEPPGRHPEGTWFLPVWSLTQVSQEWVHGVVMRGCFYHDAS